MIDIIIEEYIIINECNKPSLLIGIINIILLLISVCAMVYVGYSLFFS